MLLGILSVNVNEFLSGRKFNISIFFTIKYPIKNHYNTRVCYVGLFFINKKAYSFNGNERYQKAQTQLLPEFES